jgi:hypothetical protein
MITRMQAMPDSFSLSYAHNPAPPAVRGVSENTRDFAEHGVGLNDATSRAET